MLSEEPKFGSSCCPRHKATEAPVSQNARPLKAAGEVVIGRAKGVILDEAEKWGADLIVVGSRGLGALDRFLLGSVSHAVTQHAKCSVEVVRRRGDVSDEKKK